LNNSKELEEERRYLFSPLKAKISPIFSRFQVKNLSALPEADRLLNMPIFLFPPECLYSL